MRINIRKLVLAGMMTALGVCLSNFSFPVGVSRCFPIQHLLNVLSGVFLGPGYALGFAFSTSLLRNLLGTGSLLAFPGSMVGAVLGALLYQNIVDGLCRRNDGNGNPWRDAVLSYGTAFDGESRSCIIYICDPFSN